MPAGADLDGLRAAAEDCRGCELWEPATQTVFSAGPPDARVVLVGEQPGDQEDRQGAPFVGPAGRLLVKAVDEAGIDRATRLPHQRGQALPLHPGRARQAADPPDAGPDATSTACRPWLVEPSCGSRPRGHRLPRGHRGQGAARRRRSGSRKDRGAIIEPRDTSLGPRQFMVTIHPSAVLRADDRDAAYAGLVADLRVAAGLLG